MTGLLHEGSCFLSRVASLLLNNKLAVWLLFYGSCFSFKSLASGEGSSKIRGLILPNGAAKNLCTCFLTGEGGAPAPHPDTPRGYGLVGEFEFADRAGTRRPEGPVTFFAAAKKCKKQTILQAVIFAAAKSARNKLHKFFLHKFLATSLGLSVWR